MSWINLNVVPAGNINMASGQTTPIVSPPKISDNLFVNVYNERAIPLSEVLVLIFDATATNLIAKKYTINGQTSFNLPVGKYAVIIPNRNYGGVDYGGASEPVSISEAPTYRKYILKPSTLPKPIPIPVQPPQPIPVTPGGESTLVTGRLTDSNGNGLTYRSVQVYWNASSAITQTDASGIYTVRFAQPPPVTSYAKDVATGTVSSKITINAYGSYKIPTMIITGVAPKPPIPPMPVPSQETLPVQQETLVQCTTNSNCPVGMVCTNGYCRHPVVTPIVQPIVAQTTAQQVQPQYLFPSAGWWKSLFGMK